MIGCLNVFDQVQVGLMASKTPDLSDVTLAYLYPSVPSFPSFFLISLSLSPPSSELASKLSLFPLISL